MTENKGDLISREALKTTIIEPLNVNDACKNDWYKGYYTAKNEDIMTIDNAQTIKERSQGEWIFMRGVTCGGYYKCSNCGEVERAEKHFCPNCGTAMRGKEE